LSRKWRRVVAVDRLQETDAGDLDEILELLAGVAVARGELTREWHAADDELLAGAEIAVLVVAP
jgi:hypothetical protein